MVGFLLSMDAFGLSRSRESLLSASGLVDWELLGQVGKMILRKMCAGYCEQLVNSL